MFKRPSRALTVSIHIIVWLLFVSFPFMFDTELLSHGNFIQKMILNTLVLAAFFYTNTFLLIPKILAQKKVFLYLLITILCILLVVILQVRIDYFFHGENSKHHHSPYVLHFIFVSKAFLLAVLMLTISGGLKITSEWFKSDQKRREMENEKLSSELLFLKSQVNPHFLFNTLNNVYSLAYKKSEDAPVAILKLADLMRYMLYDSNDEKVPLEKEISYIQNYIDLQKMRISNAIKINFITEGDMQNRMIEPMLLIPFVENAFKHGVSYLENSSIDILLKAIENELVFSVDNTIPSVKNTDKDKNSGIGLQNVTRRLKLLYPNKQELLINESATNYSIKLSINFK
ncbi:MAG TPA: sensor histidine kinase [Bacteroidia bacterium]|nr:sensor histidine kinase [Bacteroidia bacterium]